MTNKHLLQKTGRGMALAAAVVATAALCLPSTADAQRYYRGGSGISPGAAVGIGLGSFALGTALGSGAFAQPWGYQPYSYGYYAPPVAYAQPRACWYPQFGGYYAC